MFLFQVTEFSLPIIFPKVRWSIRDKHSLEETYLWRWAVAIGNPERHVRKASHRGSKQE